MRAMELMVFILSFEYKLFDFKKTLRLGMTYVYVFL